MHSFGKQALKDLFHNIIEQNDLILFCIVTCTSYKHSGMGLPKKATRWRVRVAVQCGILRSQQEGEDSSSACTKRVPDYHQPIVHGALVLREKARVITLIKHYSSVNTSREQRHKRLIIEPAILYRVYWSRVPSLFQRLGIRSFPAPVSS